MAISLQERWAAINRHARYLEAQFPGQESCFVNSLTDEARDMKGGAISEVTFKVAGKLLLEKSHEIASPALVEQWKADQIVKGERITATQKRDKREFDMEDAMKILAMDRRLQAEAESSKKSKS